MARMLRHQSWTHWACLRGIGMTDTNETNSDDRVFHLLSEESRVARSARMLDEKKRLNGGQRTDIAQRVLKFMEEHGLSQKTVAHEVGISTTTISEVLRNQYKGKTSDQQLVKLHNWLELAARRENIVRSKKWVETSVARDILWVAQITAETCKIGVVFGPAQLGKTFTLQSIEGEQRFGDPVLIRIDESRLRPFALCRAIAERFEVSDKGTFDRVFHRIIERLKDTKRMLMFDEIERSVFKTIEMIRDLHDQTRCPVLLCGKPAIYAKLGLRTMGDFTEVTDQLAARVVMRRDLTLRTRGENPEPLFSADDVRRLISQAELTVHVDPSAVKWLQDRASTLGMGGLGKALVCLYLACKLAFVKGDTVITAEHLEDVEDYSMGHEDAEAIAETVAQSSGMRRIV